MIQSGDELAVYAVNFAEFYSGLPPPQRPIWHELVSSLQYWEITRAAARQAGCYRHDFAQSGLALSTTDALIAAVAQERSAIIVTNNVKTRVGLW